MSKNHQVAKSLLSRAVEVVLGAGGVRGVGHIGVLRYLAEMQVSIKRITGASVGSLVAAFATNGYTPEQMEEIFLSEEFRRPNWDVWSQMFGFGDLRTWPMSLPWMRGFSVNLEPWFRYLCTRYDLKPNKRLRIVACDAFTGKAVVFEGEDYDLSVALAASGAVTGIFTPVWLKPGSPHCDQDTEHGHCNAPLGHLLIDGFYHHPTPTELCCKLIKEPAIVSKLGSTTQMSPEPLFPVDLMFHAAAMMEAPFIEAAFPDPKGHIIIDAAPHNVAGLTFSISNRRLKEIVDYGYESAKKTLADMPRSDAEPTPSSDCTCKH